MSTDAPAKRCLLILPRGFYGFAAVLSRALEAQGRTWGGPLLNHLIYARRPSLFRGARAMWSAIEDSGLIDGKLAALVNRRVAAHNGCVF